MNRDKAIQKLIDAAGNCVDVAKRHREDAQWRVKTMQEAVALARAGDPLGAKRKKDSVDMRATVVHSYEDAHNALIEAIIPFEMERTKKTKD